MAIKKVGDNKWRIIISLGRDPITGKYRQKWITFEGTEKQARAEEFRLKLEMEQGTYIEPSNETLAEYLLRWLDTYALQNTAPRTYSSYKEIIERHLIPALGKIPIAKLTPMHLQEYYSFALREGRTDGTGGLSRRSVLYHHRILRQALKHAVRWQVVPHNVADAVEPPRYQEEKMNILDADQVRQLVKDIRGHRDYGLIFVAINTGMRRGELLALQWRDVDFDKRAIYVRHTLQREKGKGFVLREPKTQKSRRRVSISDSVIKVLREIKTEQEENKRKFGKRYQNNDLVFCTELGGFLDPPGLTRRFRKLMDDAGYPKLRFHDLRHTHATLMLSQGVHPKIVSERLGHASVNITLDTYSHVLPGLQDEAARKFDKHLFG